MRSTMLRILIPLLTFLAFALPAQAERVLVFAAASLAGPLDEVAQAFSEETGDEVVISYAGSSVLARQIEQGAPADIFLSANQGWIDHLAALGLIVNSTRRELWRNQLVLISHAPGDAVELTPELDLAGLLDSSLEGGRLAVALTASVPAGVYAQEALTALGQWDLVKDRLAESDNVRAALALVATGAAPWGIVYATDAGADPRVHLRATFPPETHTGITYPGTLVRGARAEAIHFLNYLAQPEALSVFEAAGFDPVGAP